MAGDELNAGIDPGRNPHPKVIDLWHVQPEEVGRNALAARDLVAATIRTSAGRPIW